MGDNVTLGRDLSRCGGLLFGARYLGTYPSDDVPRLTSKSPYAIMNNKTVEEGGEHWVAVARDTRDGRYIVFDTFGRRTSDLLPSLYMSVKTKDTDPDKDQLEEMKDCGARCIAWLLLLERHGEEVSLLI